MTPGYFARRGEAQGISDSYTDHRAHKGRVPLTTRVRRRASVRISHALLGLGGGDAVQRQVREVRRGALRGWLSGFDFNGREVASDPELRAWVLRETYD